ncbi:hypothetical protein AST06_11770 [Staphylococcus saprophyticus]|uniref:hypothetical protein n=1 Tax=Staphylococcus saprophyticus TaxID=29385 RepID=UPI0008538704|nr:hypothetical protein [Staphylococcus saprophyticus]OEK72703.1 hypothetical protein AST06_11770 [Staphylococcus saprophyticus]RIO40023.1 hypothetical protein BUZ70_10105 [Staphylococcus saprophyticus]
MDFQRLAKQVIIRLPTNIEKLEEDELNKIVGTYVTTHEDFIELKKWIRHLINDKAVSFSNRTITYAEFLNGRQSY